jgi:hypothetical protein
VQTAADNQGINLTLATLANATHYVTIRARGTLPAGWDWSLDNVAYTAPIAIKALDADWTVYGLQFSAAQANGSTALRIHQNGAGAGDFYIDGVQAEEKEYWTTYCDGTQEGCEWDGAEHASASSRSGQSRAGGRIRDLTDDYGFGVADALGAGAAPQALGVDEYALLPGGELNSVKMQARPFTLVGPLLGTNLHAARQALISILSPGAYPKSAEGWQPVRLRYTGADVEKEIAAHYAGGLEGTIKIDNLIHEKIALRFLAEDPFWYEIGESAEVLDSEDGATLRYVAGRLRSTGQWDDLGLTANPPAAGTIHAIAVAPDKRVYVGGGFTNLNNAGTGMDYLAVYDPVADTWSPVGPANSVNATVRALAFGPDGILYIGGEFTNLGGADGDKFSSYDPSTNTFNDVVAGAVGVVYVLAFGLDGTLYIGGSFADWGDADGDYITSWDGVALSSLGTGMDTFVYCLGVGVDGAIYAGGVFTTAGGIGANRIARWDGTAWSALSSGFNDAAHSIVTGVDGTIYVCGLFTTAGGAAANYVARWNGFSWSALSSGFDDGSYCLAIGNDDVLYAGGLFMEAGGIALADRVAKWNGSTWAHLDVNLPGAPTIHAIAVGVSDPVVKQNYDIWIGFSSTGAGIFAGDVTSTNNGTESAYPRIIISRSGGTSAILEEVRNETTGKELLFDYSLLDGETLTIDLTPTQKSIVSNFFGPRPDAILPNSDFGAFVLQPGDNLVTCFVAEAGGATVAAYMLWRDTYNGYD